MAEKNKVGRPNGYSKEVADLICEKISTSSLGLKRLHIKYPEQIPAPSMIMRWLIENEEFREQYRLAREVQMQYLEDELLEIADDSSEDIEIYISQSGMEYEKENKEFVNRSKLRIHTRMWLMGKIKPKVYGKQAEEGTKEKQEVIVKVIRGNGAST